jgi:hypothetical protein
MSYSKLYFGKELSELSYQDIENFFVDAKDESDKIEFKSYTNPDENNHNEKENGVIRAICGLLNSEGGIVIWGSPVGQIVVGKKEKVFVGALSPVNKLIEKDAFISRVTDLITPSPVGIRFQSLENVGLYVYIIEVEKSFYSPHQFRHIFYTRIDGQTRTAPHHFIEALFRKVTFPKLAGYIKIDSIKVDGNNYIMEVSNFIFNKSKLQNEYDIYYRLIITVGKFAQYGIYKGSDRLYTLDGHELRNDNAKATLYYNEPVLNTEQVIFNPYDLGEKNYECEILFSFGGKQSPLMVSKYKLRIIDPYTKDMNSVFILIEENQYSYELSDKITMSEMEKLKFILGR